MAIYHHSASIIKRSSGKSAVAGAAYRSGEKILDQRTGVTHDYTKKTEVNCSEIITPHIPTVDNSWLKDRAQLWNRVEAFEKRHDAQLAREINIAIPTELNRGAQIALVREYAKTNYVDRGMVADINFHDLRSNNPHAHIMLTMRDLIFTNGRVEFGNKNRDWNSKDLLIEQRQSWETLANKYLAAAGHDIRIDCRSLAEQGIDRIPQIHLGKDTVAMRAKGIPNERSDRYDQIDLANAEARSRLEEVYNIESQISNLEAQAATIRAEQEANKSKQESTLERLARGGHLNRIVDRVNELFPDTIGEEQQPIRPQPRPDPIAPETYMPSRLELINWLHANRDDDDRQQIVALGRQLRKAYMLQDYMQGQPEPDTLPDEFQSTTVSISLADKQRFEKKLAVQQQQKKETPLGQFIENAKQIAARNFSDPQVFETMKTVRTLNELSQKDPINRSGLKILTDRMISDFVNRIPDAQNFEKLIVKLEHIRDHPEHYQNLEHQQKIERQNSILRNNTRDRGGRGR
jgi:MobA/MobL family